VQGRLTFLGYCLTKGHGDSALITDEVMTQLETNVLNDKTKSAVAERNLAFYYPFLAAIGKETVEGKIIPQI